MKKYALLLAYLIALIAMFGSLAWGEIRGNPPCVLCWYQRICLFPLAFMLGIAAYRNERTIVRYVLPLALIGAILALYHALLNFFPILEQAVPCTQQESCRSSSGGVSLWLPFLSFTVFALIALNLTLLKSFARSGK